MRTVRSFATEEEEAAHYSKKLGHTLRKYFKMSAIYGSWKIGRASCRERV